MSEIDHEFTDEIVCPHCGYKVSDSWEWPDEGKGYCEVCGRHYKYTRDVSVTYCTEKIDEDKDHE